MTISFMPNGRCPCRGMIITVLANIAMRLINDVCLVIENI